MEIKQAILDFQKALGSTLAEGNSVRVSINGEEMVFDLTADDNIKIDIIQNKKEDTLGWDGLDAAGGYYYIDDAGYICWTLNQDSQIDLVHSDEVNHFSTYEKAREIKDKQTLFRKLQREADLANEGREETDSYYIIANDYCYEGFYVEVCVGEKPTFTPFFYNKENAVSALEKYKEELEKVFIRRKGEEE